VRREALEWIGCPERAQKSSIRVKKTFRKRKGVQSTLGSRQSGAPHQACMTTRRLSALILCLAISTAIGSEIGPYIPEPNPAPQPEPANTPQPAAAARAVTPDLPDSKNPDVKEGVAEMKEEAAYKLGVEIAKHTGIDVDGEKSYAKQEAEKAEQERAERSLRAAAEQDARDRAEMEAAREQARAAHEQAETKKAADRAAAKEKQEKAQERERAAKKERERRERDRNDLGNDRPSQGESSPADSNDHDGHDSDGDSFDSDANDAYA
jgi:hypothetical protein